MLYYYVFFVALALIITSLLNQLLWRETVSWLGVIATIVLAVIAAVLLREVGGVRW